MIDVAADAAMFSSFPGRLYSGELVRTHPPALLCDWMGRKRERERERESVRGVVNTSVSESWLECTGQYNSGLHRRVLARAVGGPRAVRPPPPRQHSMLVKLNSTYRGGGG